MPYSFNNSYSFKKLYSFNNFCAISLRITRTQGLRRHDNMVDEQEIGQTEIQQENERSEPSNWELYFLAAVDLIDECERVWGTNNISLKETIRVRLEYLILSLQLVLPFTRENMQTVSEILRNVCCLHDYWIRTHSLSCTELAIYTLETPEVVQSGNVGRPRYSIPEDVLLHLRSSGFTWTKIAEMLLVSRWTLRRRVMEFGIQEITEFSRISDEQLDGIISRFMRDHGTLVGYSLVSGHLRSIGLRVQRDRIRHSIGRVDPENSRIRWAAVISRRSYSVAGPNSLWHIDGHHSLVSWGFVIHGGIDGFSRLVVFLKCSTNNKSETMANLFLTATEKYEWPSRIRSDYGGENVGVWELMEERRGCNRGSYLVGSSTHNQRIERLWRDVFRVVTHMFYYSFQSMEEAGILNRNNNLHVFALHFIYLPRINRALESFAEAWNLHPVRTEHNWTPEQIWMNGMIDMRNEQLTAVADVTGSVNSIDEWYGFDPQAPHPGDDGLSSVVVDDIDFVIPEELDAQLTNQINPLSESNSFGIELYEQVIEIVTYFYQIDTDNV